MKSMMSATRLESRSAKWTFRKTKNGMTIGKVDRKTSRNTATAPSQSSLVKSRARREIVHADETHADVLQSVRLQQRRDDGRHRRRDDRMRGVRTGRAAPPER